VYSVVMKRAKTCWMSSGNDAVTPENLYPHAP
jgi:hypothetical protein